MQTSSTEPGVKVATTPGFARRHLGKLIGIGLVVAVGGGLALYTLVTLTFNYAAGERVGYVQKLSRKGWICRTWEGELAVTPLPGTPPQIFTFTVPDATVAEKIRQSEGKRVALQYEQKRGVPSSCFGDTEYFVRDSRVVGR